MQILRELGIYGWKPADENLALASLLTGDPLLLIGNHGSAKTLVANKIARALGKRFLVYDASKAMFEDILGYPNLDRLKDGRVEYVPSPVTVWDKDFVLIDELNRSALETQSKWLELIRSRKIMGFETRVKWVWAAMNPMTYAGAQTLDAALIGRFALFLYPPDVLQMDEADRIRVAEHINGEDAPSLSEWIEGEARTVDTKHVAEVGRQLEAILRCAAEHFRILQRRLTTLSEFLARFADLALRETGGEVALDGRRLGFLYRNLLGARSIELARAEVLDVAAGAFPDTARHTLQASIPIGLNDESVQREETLHKLEICFDLLAEYFEEGSEMDRVSRVYELFTTPDPIRKAELLLNEDLGELAACKAWRDLIDGPGDVTLLAWTALQVEARRPGTVPGELLEGLSARITGERLSTDCIASLEGECVEYIDDIEALLDQDSDLGRLVAYDAVRRLAAKQPFAARDVEATRRRIAERIATFRQLIETKGDHHEDIQTVA